MEHLIFCPDSAPNFLGLFDLSIAPPLLFYSYIPIAIISLFFGFFVYSQDKRSLLPKIFLLLSLFFSIFLINEIVQWTAVHANMVYFGWAIAALLQAVIWFLAIYFVSVFVNQRDMSFGKKLALCLSVAPIIFLIPTKFDIQFFDINNCEAVSGYLWYYLYAFEVCSILGIIYVSLRGYFSKNVLPHIKQQILILMIGMFLFLSLFAASNILGEFTKIYEVNLIGPLGMAAFLALIAFLMVRFKTFNAKLITAQALVFAIIFLVGSEFFFITTFTNYILVSFTFVLVYIGGYYLVKSVKNEIKAKEDLQVANAQLVELNKQKSEFVSFASHQLRSPLTSIVGNSSLILEGDAGPVSDSIKNIVKTIMEATKTQINVVESYLNISRIELGTMKYNLVDMDFKELAEQVMNEQKPNIEAKKLSHTLSIDASKTYKIKADADKFKQVLMNIVDNSLKYTSKGSINVSLVKDEAKGVITFKVADTGVGIRPDVMPKLFQKFSRADNANESNIHGTGLGLFIAKDIMKAHGGRVWAESEGEGKGSQFYVEVPEVK